MGAGLEALSCGCSLVIGMAAAAWAAGPVCDPWAAKAVSVQGQVEARPAGQDRWQAVQLGDTFCPGDEIRVLDNSRAGLALINESVLRLNANSAITLQELTDRKTSLVDLFKGAAHFFSRRPSSLEVRTPFVVAGVRGTEFFIRVEDEQAFLSIFEGGVLASNAAGQMTLVGGQSAVAEKGRAPVLRVVARPRDAVQWALHYPPLVYAPPDKAALREDAANPGFLTNRAAESLTVGQIDQAEADLGRALAIDPVFSAALSLQSIVALVKNDRERAHALAAQAVAADPRSSTAHIAMSYALQARFDLEGARRSLVDAVAASPDDALAHARLAEIQLSFGELDKALQSARQAAALAPGLSRTQTVLGFAFLTQVRTADARGAFETAIQADQADPLPRLGMGLARIRDGQLEQGRAEIEIAASLDPNNALIRSYLGKAFFEEKRIGLDEREYQIAKELDPNDPTPWFYSAIAKQTTNRPVEALRDFETAKELNDNRAVYRSRLLLDSDLAARSAATARIFNDLGFGQRGLLEGYKAVNADPTNFSAHRFLADTYSVLPRHEIARVSELLQSQLLQPSNMTPIQPSLAESNLFLISSGGAANTSFNEFNPLFNRNRTAVQAERPAWREQHLGRVRALSRAVIQDKLSISAGYTRIRDRWVAGKHAGQEDEIFNAFVQYELTHNTSIQAEYRYRETKYGDIRLKFFDSSIFPDQTFTSENNTFRLGGRHAFSPNSILLGSLVYQEGKFRETHDPFPQPGVLFVDFNQPEQESFGGELQHLFRSRYVNLVAGGGYFDVDDDVEQFLTFGPPFIPGPPFTPPTIDVTDGFSLDLKHGNAYAYSYINPLENLTVTIGASYDNADSEYLDEVKDQFNPKFGIAWTPFAGTTLRAAAFKTLKRTLVTQQTLEPTQVAGFNQFFDDEELTETWHYGGAVDQKFSSSLYGGLEFTYRDLKVPYIRFTGPVRTNEEADWDEYLGRAYLFWTPHEWLALRAEYSYERLKRDAELSEGVEEADTHRVPLGVNFFHPSGWSASMTATYIHQSGDFGGFFTGDTIRHGSDDFWTVDAAINYRLPKRYGFITVGATNLFDENFNYFDSDLNNASIQPGRVVFAKVTLAFP
jgi:tetratricopeptide (TPR) repeat protein